MKIQRITAGRDAVTLYTDSDGSAVLRESVPVVGAKPGRTLTLLPVEVTNKTVELPRFDGARDRVFSRFDLFESGAPTAGIRYVTDAAADVPADNTPYPQPDIKKTLGLPGELAKRHHIRQGLMNINLPALMTTLPGPDDIAYPFNGRTYYVRRAAVEEIDRHMTSVPMMTAILLNSPRLFGSTGERALLDACIHPGYDWNCSNAYISAFDMETEEGQGYYAAFVSFLVERYTRPDRKYGHLAGAIISNEVNSQYIWGNAGEMPVEAYVREYAQALRLAWLCGQRFCAHFRVYISLDQFWCGTNFDPSQTGRYYSGRRMLELLAQYTREEGDFPWNVAYHPYPEDLRWPDFWHDRAPDFTFSTPKITFKNMEVLEAFLSQESFLYRGEPRRIIFSEQGFNSQNGPMQALTERMAAAGYVLAYMKARQMKTVDLFTHHATVDNPHEFGLNLGMFRYDPEAPYHLGEAKPIFESFLAMDTEKEAAAVQKARDFIGPELFDFLLDPPVLCGERDTSQDDAFGA
ncbi:MAG: hypothetical protein IJJ23_00130 [Clostridia bacterium]|nr:hypothetical protein [Clostridia bacterium]